MECTFNLWNGQEHNDSSYCLKIEQKVSKKHCANYCNSKDYNTCPIYQKQQENNCFLTFMLTHQLEQSKRNKEILANLQRFRQNILETNPQYKALLTYHSGLSPLIIEHMRYTPNDILNEFLQVIYKAYILPINDYIINGKIEHAIFRYEKLRELLIVNFSINQQFAAMTYHYQNPESHQTKIKKIRLPFNKSNHK